MIQKTSNILVRFSTGWVTLAGLVIFVLFLILVLPAQSQKASRETGGAVSPDMSFVYTPADLYRMAESYGVEGRVAYIRARFTFDLIWPLVYTLFLGTALSWLVSRVFSLGSRWRWLNLTPLLGMLLDYLENISTSLVMFRYPQQTMVVDFLAPLWTMLKWLFVNGSFGLLFILGCLWIIRWIGKQKRIGEGAR
ncbi:MAG: hypothetical protein CVU39_00855 [Chloroflexi bacterium HGW-Chloroflexi-10]|nr:MAG: hypothetical protein CVU39_00855 [Chloroflexi bacterium HGW-Chloroflexi-10]